MNAPTGIFDFKICSEIILLDLRGREEWIFFQHITGSQVSRCQKSQEK